MTTLEMMNEAKKTNKTYISGNNISGMRYSTSKGFHDINDKEWDGTAFPYVNDIFNIDGWQLLEPKKMTLKQIEKELGYDIELVIDVLLKLTFSIKVETIIDTPKDKNGKRILFKDVILNEGYPILSKNISRQIGDVQKFGQDCWAARCFDGRETGMYDMRRWKYILSAPFKVSNKCCEIMKKKPAHRFTKKSGLMPIIGTMAYESRQRKPNGYIMGVMRLKRKIQVVSL